MDDSRQDEREHRIRVRAFEIWESEGRPTDRANEHWETARMEIEALDSEPSAPPVGEVATPTPEPELKPKKAGSKAA